MTKINKRAGATRRKPDRKQRQVVNKKQWLRFMVMIPLFIGLITVAIWAGQEDNLPILHVTIDGDFEHADKEQLVKAVTPYVTGNFIRVNVAKLREAGEALPWIRQIQVQRKWPDSLHLVVEEQQAVASWRNEALISRYGELFFPAKKTFPKELASLQGPDGMSKILVNKYIEITQALKQLDLQINELKIGMRRAWTITLNDGMKIKLGRADDLKRLMRFINVYKAGLARYKSQIKTVDMRYTNGLSVVWKSGQRSEFDGTI